MPLLIIQPNLTSEEAHEWLLEVFAQILDAIDLDADDFTACLSYKDVDAIFEKAVKGLLK